MAAPKARKPEPLQQLQIDDWSAIVQASSPLLQQIVDCSRKSGDFVAQFASAVSAGTFTGSPQLRLELLALFERRCTELCRSTEPDRIRHWYETIRDRLGNASRDGADVAEQLRDQALRTVTNVLIALDIPRVDPRLAKFHVEYLYRLLSPNGPTSITKAATPSAEQTPRRLLAPQQQPDRRFLAIECLQALETAFPTLLFKEAGSVLALARGDGAVDGRNDLPSALVLQLAATVTANVCTLYTQQQEEEDKMTKLDMLHNEFDDSFDEHAESAAEFSIENDNDNNASSNGDDEGCSGDLDNNINDVPETRIISKCSTFQSKSTTDVLQAAADALSSSAAQPAWPGAITTRPVLRTLKRVGSSTGALDSPSDVLARNDAASTLTSQQSSRRSMLASVIAADSAESPATASVGLSTSCGSISALTMALRGADVASSCAPTDISASNLASPRCAADAIITEMPILQQPSSSSGKLPTLRRFSVPQHIITGEVSDAPRLIMTAETRENLESAAADVLIAMRRMSPEAIAKMATALPPILRAAQPSPTGRLWPLLERHLTAGSTPLLRAVLDVHDDVPWLFEGRGPCLMEKVLRQANDVSLSHDHRSACVTWAVRQHAAQRHSGAQLLLADCWEQLLPLQQDAPQLAALKIKGLSACVSSGVGDEDAICRGALGYFTASYNPRASAQAREQHSRALTYALRQLEAAGTPATSSTATAGPSASRAHASLIAAILQTLVTQPALAHAVDAFVASCPEAFASSLLCAFDALLSGVDGQFEVLQERAEDPIYEGTHADLSARVKAAVISRSSSLSGLMRGLSFRLSFTRRSASVALPSAAVPVSARGGRVPSMMASIAEAPVASNCSATSANNAVDVGALRASIAAAFSSRTSAGGEASFHHHQQQMLQRSFSGASATAGNNGNASAAVVLEGRASRDASVRSGTSFVSVSAAAAAVANDSAAPASATAAAGHWNDEQMYFAPSVPTDFDDWEAAEAWLTSPATWHELAPGLLRWDLLAYRCLLQRVLRASHTHPRGTLRTLANYTWQYKEYHPDHSLPTKEAAAAILALCETAALAHLPRRSDKEWTAKQKEIADAAMVVVDAMEESGFPAASLRPRCRVLADLLQDQEAWSGDAKAATLGNMLCGYIGAAIEG